MRMSTPDDTASAFRRGCTQHRVEGETASVGPGRVKLDLGPIFDADESHDASVGGLTSPGQAPGGLHHPRLRKITTCCHGKVDTVRAHTRG